MVKVMVKIDSVLDAKKFSGICNTADFNISLVSGSYTTDAKSIMGLFSLDLSKPFELEADCEENNPVIKKLESFIIRE